MKTSNIILSILLFGVLCLTAFACTRSSAQSSDVILPATTSVNSAGFERVDYDLEVTDDGKYAILWDGERPVTALPLDNKCNLTNAILWDNQ